MSPRSARVCAPRPETHAPAATMTTGAAVPPLPIIIAPPASSPPTSAAMSPTSSSCSPIVSTVFGVLRLSSATLPSGPGFSSPPLG
jgi:hypothetical protein